jgi:hypothetical protein
MRKTLTFMALGAITMATTTGITATTVSAATPSSSQPARHGTLFRSNLVGRPTDPALTVTIRNVMPGGVPWALSRGNTRLDASGHLSVRVDGLVITGTGTNLDGTTGPVQAVFASVTCDGTTPTITSSKPVPLSPQGDATIKQDINLPAVCLAPIILVQANTGSRPWIAASGF